MCDTTLREPHILHFAEHHSIGRFLQFESATGRYNLFFFFALTAACYVYFLLRLSNLSSVLVLGVCLMHCDSNYSFIFCLVTMNVKVT